jgi:hypothetical protein
MNKIVEIETNKSMTTQDENWELMTVLGVPWTEAAKMSTDDRQYLLNKAGEVKEEQMKRHEMEMKLEADAFKQRVVENNPTN